ncbi:acid protease [Vararia minispora EC-137]|uniref:Acid protease n=1 Tax=Vararia minispora EC-137 TaxID=1314806 RepID=A0ACB8QN78_9AGAM|nr:acid protease [Vararia minispora EC-137]
MRPSAAALAVTFPALVEALPASAPKGLPIPLSKRDSVRRADGSISTDALRASVQNSVAKIYRGIAAFERNTGSAHSLANLLTLPPFKEDVLKRQAASGRDPLTDDQQVLWFGTIEVGTPPKQYTVDFDTGSSDLFLPGPDCNSSCANHTIYDPSGSSTSADLGQTFSLAYGDGSTVSGNQFTDSVAISGLTARNQTLGAATTYSSGFMSPNFPADGLMGMAFPSISVYGANPVFQTLIQAGAVSEPIFGFKLAPEGAELFVGGMNTALIGGDVTFVPVTREGYWQVEMDAITVNGRRAFSIARTSAIIDTGTTLIVGDTQSVQNVYESITGAVDNGDGTWSVPCDATPQVSLTFNGTVFSITPEAFVLGSGSSTATQCIGGLSYDDSIAGQFWIVGDVFLQNVYTVFDVGNSQVGFITPVATNVPLS